MLPPRPSSQPMSESHSAKTTEAIRKALPQVLPSHLSPSPPTCTAFPPHVPTRLVSINPVPKDTPHSPSCLHHHFLPLGWISPISVSCVLFLPFLSNATNISPPSKIKQWFILTVLHASPPILSCIHSNQAFIPSIGLKTTLVKVIQHGQVQGPFSD